MKRVTLWLVGISLVLLAAGGAYELLRAQPGAAGSSANTPPARPLPVTAEGLPDLSHRPRHPAGLQYRDRQGSGRRGDTKDRLPRRPGRAQGATCSRGSIPDPTKPCSDKPKPTGRVTRRFWPMCRARSPAFPNPCPQGVRDAPELGHAKGAGWAVPGRHPARSGGGRQCERPARLHDDLVAADRPDRPSPGRSRHHRACRRYRRPGRRYPARSHRRDLHAAAPVSARDRRRSSTRTAGRRGLRSGQSDQARSGAARAHRQSNRPRHRVGSVEGDIPQ
jgi:hypothetical protein